MIWIFHIGIAQSFFSAFLLFSRKGNSLSDRLLAFWMIFIGMELWHMLLEINGSPLHVYTSNFGFYSLTFGPFLYLYISKLTDENAAFTWRDLLHFSPYIIFSLIHLIFFTNRALLSDELELDQGWFALVICRVIALCVSLLVYSILALKIISKHRSSIKDTYSFESSKITLKWLRLIIMIFVITYLILIINMLAGNIIAIFFNTSHLIPATGLTFFCFSLSYFGFNQFAIFRKSGGNSKGGNDFGTLSPSKRRLHQQRLSDYLTKEKPYLNPELTIGDLADHVKIPRFYITDILKHEIKKNFFTLIQDYRIGEVKQRLTDPALAHVSVLQIALQCGFNSKSSFNALFKQYTGMTPSQYRKKVG